MNWILKKFDELSVHELYSLLQLRNEVFIIEQNCIYPDLDNKDQEAYHLLCFENNLLIAYSRILPPGISYATPSIGRVVIRINARRLGLGKELMSRSIESCKKLFGITSITLSAQLYLKNFYTSLGFSAISNVYLEDGIEHIKMKRDAST